MSKILFVDDEVELCEVIRDVLQQNGHTVVTATSGTEGLRKAQSELPDLIILDIMMADMDGGAVAETLKETKNTATIPIIYLTALISKREALQKRADGAYFLAKPVEIDELLAMINEVLNK